MKLTNQQAEFLLRLRDGRPIGPANDEADKVRQFCRRQGLAEVVMNPRRWIITDAGRAALGERVQK